MDDLIAWGAWALALIAFGMVGYWLKKIVIHWKDKQ